MKKKLQLLVFILLIYAIVLSNMIAADNPNPPANPVKLIFLHHSTGQNWLNDQWGGLGIALRDNNYYVSDTNYGWGPEAIGDKTDIGQFWLWFRGPNSSAIMDNVYTENGQYCNYSRIANEPSGTNTIVMFKSCFPNSAIQGSVNDPVPNIEANLLKGESAGSDSHTIANAKGIYVDILKYFISHPEKLFILITAPPLSDATYSGNARVLNQWLMTEWLKDYTLKNVFVFDFFNVLTTNGGSTDISDANAETGNHHRWHNNQIQYLFDGVSNTSKYASGGGDDHPNETGSLKATIEYLPLLNIAYNRWKASATDIDEDNSINIFSVYPNPATDYICISSSDFNIHNIKIINQIGDEILNNEYSINETKKIIKINLDKLANGIYYLLANNGNQSLIKQITILK